VFIYNELLIISALVETYIYIYYTKCTVNHLQLTVYNLFSFAHHKTLSVDYKCRIVFIVCSAHSGTERYKHFVLLTR